MAKPSVTCGVAGCSRLVSRDGYCRPHYLYEFLFWDVRPKEVQKLEIGRLNRWQLSALASLPPDSPPRKVMEAVAQWVVKPRSAYLTKPQRFGPPTRTTCRRCEYLEVRDGLCKKHWLARHGGRELRRDTANKIPIERLTAAQIEAICELPRGHGWRSVLAIARVLDDNVETLEAEAERRDRRASFNAAARTILAMRFGGIILRAGMQLGPPAQCHIELLETTSVRARIMVALCGWLAESAFTSRPRTRTDAYLWDAIGCVSGLLRPCDPHDGAAFALLIADAPEATRLQVIASYRSYEEATIQLIRDSAVRERIECLASALQERRSLSALDAYQALLDRGLLAQAWQRIGT